jgi:hypothetical protein
MAGAAVPGGAGVAAALQVTLSVLIGAGAMLYLSRRRGHRPAMRRPVAVSLLLSAVAGAALGAAETRLGLGGALGGSALGAGAPVVLALAALVLFAEETLLRGIIQRGMAEELSRRGLSAAGARWGGAAASVGLAAMVSLTWAGAAPLAILISHAAGATTFALTGRTSASWLARAFGLGAAITLTATWPST